MLVLLIITHVLLIVLVLVAVLVLRAVSEFATYVRLVVGFRRDLLVVFAISVVGSACGIDNARRVVVIQVAVAVERLRGIVCRRSRQVVQRLRGR